jgi:pimeloyl-ACP methyl ester carboxylesterase
MTTDVIILHGAWHRPAHYEDVAARLRALGLAVELPDLHRLTLDESTARVQAVVEAAGRAPVVVGHSFGGVTAGTIKGASAYVFLAAWVLDAGESPGALLAKAQAGAGSLATTMDAEGLLHLDPADARVQLYDGVPGDAADRAVGLLRPEPPAIFGATPAAAPWHDAESVYIAARDETTIAPSLVGLFAGRCTTSQTWPTGHSPYLTHPAEVAGLIANLAGRQPYAG